MAAVSVVAQTQVKGEVEASAGYGNVTPWNGKVSMDISTPKLNIKPFFGIAGIQRYTSEDRVSMDYTFTGVMPLSLPLSVGSRFTSEYVGDRQGTAMEYGVEASYTLSDKDRLTASVKGTNQQQNQNGTTHEMLFNAGGAPMRGGDWTVSNPHLHENNLTATANYHRGNRQTKTQFDLDYSYQREYEDAERTMKATTLVNFTDFAHSQLQTNAETQRHNAKAQWRTAVQNHTIGWGARYENQLIAVDNRQWLDGSQVLDGHFTHSYHTAAAFAEYGFRYKSLLNVNAGIEYDYTRMDGRNLHDYIPRLSVMLHPAKASTFILIYGRRIIRPTLSYLNPDTIRGTFTKDYGNAHLTGIHASNFQLRYSYKSKPVDVNAFVQHIRSNDGFNGIWMERNGIRQYTWQNEGVRRAWALNADVRWNITEKTLLVAGGEVMWDKRVADAIHMQNANWGGRVNGMLQQVLPFGILARVDCAYSEGYTLDLYSNTGRSLRYGAEVEKSFLKGSRLKATLAYHHCQYPEMVITQGAYTGSLFDRNTNNHQAELRLAYRFAK